MVDEDQKEGSLGEKAYWKDLWECYIEEKSMDYASLSVKEAIPRLVSEQNLRERVMREAVVSLVWISVLVISVI